jgi:hydroxymethylbilane synthase
MLAAVEHGPSRRRIDAERAFLAELGGDCDLPAGAHATLDAGEDAGVLRLEGFLAASDVGGPDRRVVRHTAAGDDAESVGLEVARYLRAALG